MDHLSAVVPFLNEVEHIGSKMYRIVYNNDEGKAKKRRGNGTNTGAGSDVSDDITGVRPARMTTPHRTPAASPVTQKGMAKRLASIAGRKWDSWTGTPSTRPPAIHTTAGGVEMSIPIDDTTTALEPPPPITEETDEEETEVADDFHV